MSTDSSLRTSLWPSTYVVVCCQPAPRRVVMACGRDAASFCAAFIKEWSSHASRFVRTY